MATSAKGYYLDLFSYFLRISFMASSRSSFCRLLCMMARILNFLIRSSSSLVLYEILAIQGKYFNSLDLSNKKVDVYIAISHTIYIAITLTISKP